MSRRNASISAQGRCRNGYGQPSVRMHPIIAGIDHVADGSATSSIRHLRAHASAHDRSLWLPSATFTCCARSLRLARGRGRWLATAPDRPLSHGCIRAADRQLVASRCTRCTRRTGSPGSASRHRRRTPIDAHARHLSPTRCNEPRAMAAPSVNGPPSPSRPSRSTRTALDHLITVAEHPSGRRVRPAAGQDGQVDAHPGVPRSDLVRADHRRESAIASPRAMTSATGRPQPLPWPVAVWHGLPDYPGPRTGPADARSEPTQSRNTGKSHAPQ